MASLKILYPNDALYPQAFNGRRSAPPPLYYQGNTELLSKPSVGFCGSRKVSELGRSVAHDCTCQLSRKNIVIVSGYAAGVDMETHLTALAEGGTTIIVLAEGFDHFRIKKEISDLWDWNRVLVLSQFPPESIWTVYRAMERNNLIAALSKAMVVIEAGERGGTLNAGMTTLKIGKPLFVVDYQQNEQAVGNKALLAKGGRALKKNRSSASANVQSILDIMPLSITPHAAQYALPL